MSFLSPYVCVTSIKPVWDSIEKNSQNAVVRYPFSRVRVRFSLKKDQPYSSSSQPARKEDCEVDLVEEVVALDQNQGVNPPPCPTGVLENLLSNSFSE